MQLKQTHTEPLKYWQLTVLFMLLLFSSKPYAFTLPEESPQQTDNAFCDVAFNIPENSCTSSSNFQFSVQNAGGTELGNDIVIDEVRLIINHDWVSDLSIYLTSPSGVKVPLSIENGNNGVNYGDPNSTDCETYTTFSTTGCTSIKEAAAPFIGTFLPEGSFADFYDGSDPNGVWTIQVCDNVPDNTGFLDFLELVFDTNTCQPIINVNVESIGSDHVDLSWLGVNPNCSDLVIEYGPTGFTPGTGATAGGGTAISPSCGSTIPFTLTGLDQLMIYDIYIRQACNSSDYTENSCVVTFETNCDLQITATIQDIFDDQSECGDRCDTDCSITGTWKNSTADEMDWLIHDRTTRTSKTGPSDDITGGGNYIYFESSTGRRCPANSRAVLNSNCIHVDASQAQCHLSFYTHLFGQDIGQLDLDISLDNGDSWSGLWSVSGNQGDLWQRNFIDLSQYDGVVIQLRFVAIRGAGFEGDMAIDHIEFFGPTDIGVSLNTFYRDIDQDGFGNPIDSIISCGDVAPNGYVTNDLDCDDTESSINNNAAEIFCNGIDENCNGMADDAVIPPISVSDVEVCRGGITETTIIADAAGQYYWFTTAGRAGLLDTGKQIVLGILNQSRTVYVQDSLPGGCATDLFPVRFTVVNVPSLQVGLLDDFCSGDSVVLSDLPISDINVSGSDFTYHSSTPPDSSNMITASKIVLNQSMRIYVKAENSSGCSDETFIDINVLPLPNVSILPTESLSLCANGTGLLIADADGNAPLSYRWNIGNSNDRITISAGVPGSTSTYTTTVTDQNGCSNTAEKVVSTLNSVTRVALRGITDASNCGANDGEITIEALNGNAPFDIDWTGPTPGSIAGTSGQATLTNLQQGSYRITITEQSAASCNVILPSIIVNGPSVVVDTFINIIPVSCEGVSDGQIDLTILTSGNDVLWSNGETTEDITNLSAGFYSVTISDGACQQIISDLEVTEATPIRIQNEFIEDVSCFGGSDGLIVLQAAGGNGDYQYQWSGGGAGPVLSGLTADSYSVTIEDQKNCTAVFDNLVVKEPMPIEITIDQIKLPDCPGNFDAGINVSVSGGSGNYTYNWNNGQLIKNIDALPNGVYDLTVTDENNCFATTGSILIEDPEAITVELIQKEDVSCQGVNDGSITINVTGGSQNYQFQWNSGDTTQNLNSLAPGIYEVTVIDENSCTEALSNISIEVPEVLEVQRIFLGDTYCPGIQDGFIDLEIEGGTTPYQYQWSSGQQSEDINQLDTGFYTVTITDQNNCQLVLDDLGIDIIFPLSLQSSVSTDVSCFGLGDGSVFVEPGWNATSFDYNWNNGGQQQFLSNLNPGAYICTITDVDGCRLVTDTIVVQEPEQLGVEIESVENVSCFGAGDGNVEVTVNGGTAPYDYSWNNGISTRDLLSVSPGNYRLIVRDANNCGASSSFVSLTQAGEIDLSVDEVIHVGCAGRAIGSFDVSVLGGTSPYSLLWSTGDTTSLVRKLFPGLYSLTVTDGAGCERIFDQLEILNLPDSLTVEFETVESITCPGQADGRLIPGTISGRPPFQFNWSNGVTDSINSGLVPGEYQLTVTDGNGCVGVSEFVLIESLSPFVLEQVTIQEADCTTDSLGSIGVMVSGGEPPYQILWSNGDQGTFIDQLPAGNYQFTLTDAKGCTYSPNAMLQVPQANDFRLVGVETEHVNCFGDSSGSIRVLVDGGKPGYAFQWNNGRQGAYIDDLNGGTYFCGILDSLGCEVQSGPIIINEPDTALYFDALNTVVVNGKYCDEVAGGQIDLNVAGGTAPYTYFWNNLSEEEDQTNLPQGIYNCFVEDANGCLMTTPDIEVDFSQPIEVIPQVTFPDQDKDSALVSLDITGGTAPYMIEWDANAGNQTSTEVEGLTTGIYIVIIIDADGCKELIEIEVARSTAVNPLLKSEQPTLKIYPNPISNWLTIEILESNQQVELIQIKDLLGRSIDSQAFASGPKTRYDLNFSNYQPGIYLIELKMENNQRYLYKVVKQ